MTRTDCGFRAADPFFSRVFTGLRRPKRKIVGLELAGVVEAVGDEVTEFAVGDRVFGLRGGANAELVCVREHGALAHPPRDELRGGRSPVRRAEHRPGLPPVGPLRDGRTILIYGASGAIGTAAVQIAKATGAQVTAVCDTKRVDLVRSLGATEVVDYTREDFTQNGKTYDVVFDAGGVGKHSFRRCRNYGEARAACTSGPTSASCGTSHCSPS